MKWLDKLLGVKAKDKVKNHTSCDFGIKEFNKNKRSRAFVEEIKLAERKRGKPTKPTTDPYVPPTTPPPTNPTTPERGVLLLVFNGATVANTGWNVFGSLTLEHSGLTLEEQDFVLQAVKADYSTFGDRILVTTDQAIYDAAPYSRRSRIIITESYEWFGNGAGGVAFVGSFGNATENVGFVFSSLLGYNLKFIMEAVSHESAHQFGCYHQSVWVNGVKTEEYNRGADGVAPIPGIAYYQPEGKWWYGMNSRGQMQDDAQVIRNKLG